MAAALTTLLVNARHLFYGISMVDRYRKAGKAKAYLIKEIPFLVLQGEQPAIWF